MKKLIYGVIFSLIILTLTVSTAVAQSFPPHDGYVNDFAGLLSPEFETELEGRLSKLEQDTSAEVAVVTVETIGDNTIEDYAVRLFEDWGIGKKGKDNGVLFITAEKERKVRIEVGYGLEPIINDGRAGRILDRDVIPDFRDGKWENGFRNGINSIEGYIREGTTPGPLDENPVKTFFSGNLIILIFLGYISIYIIGFMARTKSIWLGGVWGTIVGVVVGLAVGGLIVLILIPLFSAVFGIGLDWTLSRNYKKRKEKKQPTSWHSSYGGFRGPSGGGSFRSGGGFGGGRSGGGGASRGF